MNNPLKKIAVLELTCSKCNKKWKVRVNDINIYTDEVKKNWTCMLCKSRREKK